MDSDRSYWTGWGGPQSPLLHGVDIDHPKRIEGDDVKLTDRVVAFVDILGFRSLVENSTMESAVSTVVSLEEALYHIGNRPHHDFEVSKLFSDTIYFSAPVHWQGVNWVFGKSMVA